MKPIFFGSLLIAFAMLIGCDLQNDNGKTDLSGCWQVIDTTMGEALFATDTGRLELEQSGKALKGYITWSKADFYSPDSVAGTVEDSITLRVINLTSKDSLAFAGEAKEGTSFRITLQAPKSLFPRSDVWTGSRISCPTPIP